MTHTHTQCTRSSVVSFFFHYSTKLIKSTHFRQIIGINEKHCVLWLWLLMLLLLFSLFSYAMRAFFLASVRTLCELVSSYTFKQFHYVRRKQSHQAYTIKSRQNNSEKLNGDESDFHFCGKTLIYSFRHTMQHVFKFD